MPINTIIVAAITVVHIAAVHTDNLLVKALSQAMPSEPEAVVKYGGKASGENVKLVHDVQREHFSGARIEEALERPESVNVDEVTAFLDLLNGSEDPRIVEAARVIPRQRTQLVNSLRRSCQRLNVEPYDDYRALDSMSTDAIAALVFLAELAQRYESSELGESAGLLFQLVRAAYR